MEERIKQDIAMDSQLGFWVMEIFSDGSRNMYGDEVFYYIIGMEEKLSPKQLHKFWLERVHPDYIQYVQDAAQKMISGQKTEVEYPWNHPELGWILVRCGGRLDRKTDTSIRIRGYHHNIGDILKYDLEKFHTHEVLDLYKFSKYAPYLLGAYDEIFEIDPTTYYVRTIAYKKEKYLPIIQNYFNRDVIQKRVYEEDKERVLQFLSQESIQEIKNSKYPKSIEFRTRVLEQTFIWVKGMAFWITFNGQDKLLFVTKDIEDQKRIDLLTKDNEDIIQSLVSDKAAILDINLVTQQTKFLKYDKRQEIDVILPLEAFKEKFIRIYLTMDKEELFREFLSIEMLRECARNKKEKSIDLKFRKSEFEYEWIRCTILVPPNTEDRVFLLIRNIHQEQLLQYIMENFVYQSCEQLYYIDLKNDWFIQFSGNVKRTDRIHAKGSGYKKRMEQFVEQFISIEDRDRVKEQMDPDNILRQLEANGYVSFTTGFLEEDEKKQKKYARKRIQIQYYDKENQIILMQSMDITKFYLQQEKVNLELEKAKIKAKMDFLTGLYNRLGCEEMIQSYIEERKENQYSAFVLFDLDNFKLINDYLGHQKGDEVLKIIAQILKSNFRETDIIARLGGDEFVVFLKDIRNKEDIEQIIAPVLDQMNLAYFSKKGKIHVSASAGITFVEKNQKVEFSTLYKEADMAMYYAKNMGKNNYQIYSYVF